MSASSEVNSSSSFALQWTADENAQTHPVSSCLTTVGELAKGIFKNIFEGDDANQENIPFNRLCRPGKQLTSSIVLRYTDELKDKVTFNVIPSFLIRPINGNTLEQVKRTLNFAFGENLNSTTVCIPIVLGQGKRFEMNHIVTVAIKDGNIEYYDPKGIKSESWELHCGATVRDVLDYLNTQYLKGKGQVLQNSIAHQKDIHSCGVFSCYYIFQTFCIKRKLGSAFTPPADINSFRAEIYHVIKK